jgi:GDPmannose 4,6-dehydratase
MSVIKKRALITGVTGQDGIYLSSFLVSKNYEVFGMVRNTMSEKITKLKSLVPEVNLVYGDILDTTSLQRILIDLNPDEIYNLASISFVGQSWQQPLAVAQSTGMGVINVLESIRLWRQTSKKSVKFYQASSSEMYGKVQEVPQNENTPFYPRSPYGVSKVFGHDITVNYRESFDLFAVSGILFNHESPLRGTEFVTRKITSSIRGIKEGRISKIKLGNLNSQRDWGFAGDYVKGMWAMLQSDEPKDFVLATGETHSVSDFLKIAFEIANLGDWQNYVEIDLSLLRPAEVDLLIGDPKKAKEELGWQPEKDFSELVGLMVKCDLLDEKPNMKVYWG